MIRHKKTTKGIRCQLQLSTDRKFQKIIRRKTVKGTVKTITLKTFQKGTYYVRMRSIRTIKQKKQYSTWSPVKTIRVSRSKKVITSVSTAAPAPATRVPSSGQSDEELIREWMIESSRHTPAPAPSGTRYTTSTSKPSTEKDASSTGKPADAKNNPNNSGDTGTSHDPIRLEDCSTAFNQSTTLYYNGKGQCPSVSIYTANGYLVPDVDYTVSYENNINVGTAVIHIRGIGKYSGEITKTFTIEKSMPDCNPSFSRQEAVAGKALPIHFEKQPEGICTYKIRDVKSHEYLDDIRVSDNGEVSVPHSGIFHVYAEIEASDNYYSMQYDLGEIAVCDEENPDGGFAASVYSGEGTAKTTVAGPVIENGTGSFTISYTSDASDAWLDRHMRFEVEDATPAAYTKAFQWLGADMTAPSVTVTNSSEELRSGYEYDTISGPCVDQTAKYTEKYGVSARRLTITAGIGVRVCKVKAYRDDTLYDVAYVATIPKDADGNSLDEELYATARHKVEDKLWTDDLGLPYLYDSSTLTIADGKGVWLATGKYSSTPSAGHHVSVIYKDAGEKRSFIDAQGLMTDTPCESHNCLSKVLRD